MNRMMFAFPLRGCRAGLVALGIVVAGGCGVGEGELFTVRGSARLPKCSEPASFDLGGSVWVDSGSVTVRTTGCLDAGVGDVLTSCGLRWAFAQQGQEITITVDNEYRVLGRMCGDQLHLEGGWWLPVADEIGNCSYTEEYASEVGIEAGGSTLVATADALAGVLGVKGACTADYTVTFSRLSVR